ncbi:hypothetical protein [Algoriphagus aquimarinus]|uniref:hypothetical protein n=1 Tax=Algoriphagus aquimarinus TaxID=237018 RepID=UPI0030D90BC6|tara:strand:+ start:2968 stop:3708 length:741 start_codon:yes stop_codon:yes gene_type:complete
MLESREEILKLNNCFTEHLISVQKAKYEPTDKWIVGESVILDDSDDEVVLTKEQADKLNKEEQQYFLDNRDEYNSQNLNKWIGRTTLTSSKKDSQGYLNDLGQSLTDLSRDYGELIILGDWNTPWLNQQNDYPPVAKALQFLSQKIDKKFNGGFVLNSDEISEFTPYLFWLTRCNASLPEFMMTFKNSKTVIEICKYGVLHLEFYGEQEREKLMNFFNDREFEEVDSCNDPIEFDNFKGRKIKISS